MAASMRSHLPSEDLNNSWNNYNRMDKGWAWVVLAGCFMNRMLNDGVLGSLGVFVISWRIQFPESVSQLTWITSLIVGITHISGPLGSALCKIFSIRQVVICGSIIATTSFIAASFATELWHLYVTFAFAGVGFGLTFLTSTVILAYYFDARLARANGISSAGVAIATFVLPPFFQLSIDYYGWRGTLLILAGLVGNIGVCGALYRPTTFEREGQLRSRAAMQTDPSKGEINPPQPTETSTREISVSVESRNGIWLAFMRSVLGLFDFSLFRNFYFDLLLMSYFPQGVAYIIAIHYLSIRAVHVGISKLNAAYLISAIGISSLISRISHGYLIDYHILSASVLTALSYLLCGIACALNPLIDNYAGLVVLSALVGLSSGVFVSTNALLAKEYIGMQRISGGIGFMLLMVGVGSMLGAYLTGVLVDATDSFDMPFYLAGACFVICSLLVFAFPIIRYLRGENKQADDGNKQTHGDTNITMEIIIKETSPHDR